MDFDRNDKKYWKLGLFYFNPADEETAVPKRVGIGSTPNFGKPFPLICAALLVLGIIALVVVFH
jgi:uncharacterized membrane protein